ncbi:MAG: hypothetical protein ABIS01_08810 [Ferruginibacter sp.]
MEIPPLYLFSKIISDNNKKELVIDPFYKKSGVSAQIYLRGSGEYWYNIYVSIAA